MVYLQTLRRLQLPASQCIAFEDSANGLQAAKAAGLLTVITPTRFTAEHDFTGALKVLPELQGVTVAKLQAWHTQTAA
jgi:beta-phosphoglucomutase-like phosphatase (HAD superfamily)